MISKQLLEILACPRCKAAVKLETEKLVCVKCAGEYLIKNGIPVMIIDKAQDIITTDDRG